MFTDNVTAAGLIAQAQRELSALAAALTAIQHTQQWLSGLSLTDLEGTAPNGLGLSAGYAQALKSAYADADALRQIYQAGQPPSTYPQAATAYVYETSQAPVIGP